MWGSKLKKTKAVDHWHTKAMLVDPKKTKITMIWSTSDPDICEKPESGDFLTDKSDLTIMESNDEESFNRENSGEKLDTASASLENSEKNLELVEKSFETEESCVSINLETDSSTEDVQAEFPGLQIGDSGTERQITEDPDQSLEYPLSTTGSVKLEAENAGTDAPENLRSEGTANLEAIDSEKCEDVPDAAEIGSACEPLENLEVPNSPMSEEHTGVASAANLGIMEAKGTENASDLEVTDNVSEFVPVEREPLNVQFLRALEKTRSMWDSDEKFSKIVQKMEKGKNLKRKEFERVYLHIHTYCRYH